MCLFRIPTMDDWHFVGFGRYFLVTWATWVFRVADKWEFNKSSNLKHWNRTSYPLNTLATQHTNSVSEPRWAWSELGSSCRFNRHPSTMRRQERPIHLVELCLCTACMCWWGWPCVPAPLHQPTGSRLGGRILCLKVSMDSPFMIQWSKFSNY